MCDGAAETPVDEHRRGAKRLVCKAARAALDADLQKLTLSTHGEQQERVQAQSIDPELQRLLAMAGIGQQS